ncbi:MAG TPA: PepSY domain-containing protein [Nitrospira sp.]|nr:PepSY domain-containing protein [Nitrospira sp.]
MKYDHDRMMKVRRTIEMVNEATVTIEQAIAAVAPIGGTIFEMRLKEVEDRVFWRVKMVRDGERVKVNIDAKSGLIIEAKAEVAVGDGFKSQLTV